MTFGLFEILGGLAVKDKATKLLILDTSLRRESRRIVAAANKKEDRGENEIHRAFVIDSPLPGEEFGTPLDPDRPLRQFGQLSLLQEDFQGNLVNFRDGSVVVAFRTPDDGSNDQNAFPIWLDAELPTGQTFSVEQVAREYLVELCPDLSAVSAAQEFDDCVRRMVSALNYVAQAYAESGRTERASTGAQWLVHVDVALNRFSQVVNVMDPRSPRAVLELVQHSFFPAVSLPNPRSGDSYGRQTRSGSAKSVASAIDSFWREHEGVNLIAESISSIDESRLKGSPPIEATRLGQIDWSSIRRTWMGTGLASDFLSWHTHDTRIAGSSVASRIQILSDLTEDEFFCPLPGTIFDIGGVWPDGRPLRPEELDTNVVILSPTQLDEENQEIRSDMVQLLLAASNGARLSEETKRQIELVPKRARGRGRSAGFRVISVNESDSENVFVVEGYFFQQISGKKTFTFSPEVIPFKSGGEGISVGQEMKVLFLPPEGAGFLMGKNLKYFGPKKFDMSGSPIWDNADMDEETKAFEFVTDKDAGSQVEVIAWSSTRPAAVALDGALEEPWSDRGFLRWSRVFVARPDEHHIDIRWEGEGLAD